jgi:hypothetical protein
LHLQFVEALDQSHHLFVIRGRAVERLHGERVY